MKSSANLRHMEIGKSRQINSAESSIAHNEHAIANTSKASCSPLVRIKKCGANVSKDLQQWLTKRRRESISLVCGELCHQPSRLAWLALRALPSPRQLTSSPVVCVNCLRLETVDLLPNCVCSLAEADEVARLLRCLAEWQRLVKRVPLDCHHLCQCYEDEGRWAWRALNRLPVQLSRALVTMAQDEDRRVPAWSNWISPFGARRCVTVESGLTAKKINPSVVTDDTTVMQTFTPTDDIGHSNVYHVNFNHSVLKIKEEPLYRKGLSDPEWDKNIVVKTEPLEWQCSDFKVDVITQ